VAGSRPDVTKAPRPHGDDDGLGAIAAARTRLAVILTVAVVALYFGFILLVAFAKPFLAARIVPGLTVGIVLGATVIVASWALTWVYVRWANRHYDGALRRIGRGRG
jgi:uncharacterized membrane protein (DUF485 family)